MAGVQIKLDPKGVAKLLKSDDVRDFLTERAEQVLSKAQADGPVDTGEYVDGLHIVQDTTDRAVVRVTSSAPHAWAVEVTTGNLARALDAAG